MDIVFPFYNITANTLWDFFEKEKIKEFSDIKNGKNVLSDEYFDEEIQRWRDWLPSLENEILQTINTTDQKTIDEYFNRLIAQLAQFASSLSKDFFIENISLWNEEILNKYQEKVEKEGEEYAKKEDRKRRHLEEYEEWDFGPVYFMGTAFGNRKPEKIKRINYNFYCVEEIPDVIDEKCIDEYLQLLKSLGAELDEVTKKYIVPWQEGKLKSKIEEQFIPKPIVFVEGGHDITLITKAAELLNKTELLSKIELRQRGGYRNLDKLWDILREESWETSPQTKIFLYDCDTKKQDEDFGIHYKRTIPSIPNSIIKKGIENLFPDQTINKAKEEKKAFVDFKKILGTRRGDEYQEEENEINKDEKKNFCEWVCTNGTAEDFANFTVIFDIIEKLI